MSDQAGHVVGESYIPITTDQVPDFIEIESIENGIYRGRFGGSFVRELKKEQGVDRGDTIILSEGTFWTRKLEDQD